MEVVNLGYSYPDGTVALNGVDFRITHGESVALIGENGAGKSTLLTHLNGSLLASAGEVRIGDLVVSKRNLPVIRSTVGMVFQNADDQLFMPTVEDDVSFGPLNMGLSNDEVIRRIDSALDLVGVLSLKKRSSHRLSGGEKRRVAIASVLSMEPKILAMDEPTSGLDPKSRRLLIALLKSFNQTKILASHDFDMIAGVCDRTIVIYKGEVAADGPTAEILADISLLERCSLS